MAHAIAMGGDLPALMFSWVHTVCWPRGCWHLPAAPSPDGIDEHDHSDHRRGTLSRARNGLLRHPDLWRGESTDRHIVSVRIPE